MNRVIIRNSMSVKLQIKQSEAACAKIVNLVISPLTTQKWVTARISR